MKWLTHALYRNRRITYLGVGLLFALLLFVLPRNQKLGFCGLVQTVGYGPFWSLAGKIQDLLTVYDVNIELRALLAENRLERLTYEEAAVENQRFREMLQLLPKPEFDIIPADAVAYDQGRRLSTLIIRSSESLEPFLPVVDENGLVGKISAATDQMATVSLLIGPNCRVAGRDKRSRDLGIVKWQTGRDLYFDNVSLDADVAVGDTVISSGLGGVFPEGLIIGVVTSVATAPGAFFQQITIQPAVDFGSIDNVMVLRQKGGRIAP
jgi:rod shape-determining protein MreC